jgi:penicillin-binding protein 1A
MIEISRAFRKPAVLVSKLLAALLMLSGPVLLAWSGLLVWHFEYGLGLPDHRKLAAIAGTEQICSAGHRRSFVPLAEIPPLLRNAVLAEEEPDFYGRPAILREYALAALSNRYPRPATIAIHPARCLMPPECCRGLDRPIGTLVLLDRVDKILSKDTIFEIYLNEVYLGRGSYGVADAAASYFGKSLGELKPEEVAFIVGHAKQPSPGNNQEAEIRFRNRVIARMLDAGVIGEAVAASATTAPLLLRERPEALRPPGGAQDGPSPPQDP